MGTRAVVSEKRKKNKPGERPGPRLPQPKRDRAKKTLHTPEEFTRRKGIDVARTSTEIIDLREEIIHEILLSLREIQKRVGRLTQVPTARDITKRVNELFNERHSDGERPIFFAVRTVAKSLPARYVVVRKARQTTKRAETRAAVREAMAEAAAAPY
jgi:hypothetical protein